MTVEEVVELDPATVRADAPLTETHERLASNAPSITVSTREGLLLGLFGVEAP